MAAALNEIPPPIPVPPPILGEPKFPMMETRMFNDTPMYITTIPKGTLLFRGMNKSADRKADFYGVKQPNGAYFLPKQYEIYFYPFPGIDQVVGNFDLVVIYVLTQDVKLATLITPSPHVRGDKNDIAALVSCDRIDFKPLNGRPDDPCFRPDFLNQNPDISGMIAIANDDREQFHSYERMVRSFEAENPGIELGFYSKYDDASKPSKYTKGGGIPELILYPLNGRRETMYLNVPSDPIQELAFRGNNHVYAEYYIHTEGSTSKTFETYLIDLFGAGAKVGERTMQARVDKTTGFLVDPTLYSEDPDNLEDIDSIKERSPEFRFQRYRRGSSRRKTYKVQKQRRRKTFRKK